MAFERVKELFGAESEGSSTDHEIPLLSSTLRARGNYLSPSELEPLMQYAKELRGLKEPLSEAEESWLTDYISNIPTVFNTDWALNLQVLERARQGREDQVPSEVTAGQKAAASTGSPNKPALPPRPTSPSLNNKANAEVKQLQAASRITNQEDAGIRSSRPLPIPPIKLNELAIKPEVFKGAKLDARNWIEDYEAAASSNGWSDELKVKYFPTFLAKSARDWFTGIAMPKLGSRPTFINLRSLFVRYYVGPEEEMAIRMEIERTRQRNDEPSTEFIARLIRLLNISGDEQSERTRVLIIRSKLRGAIQAKMTLHKPRTIEELNDACLEIERCLDATDRHHVKKNVSPEEKEHHFPRRNRQARFQGQKQASKQDLTASKKCSFCSKAGHVESSCYKKHGYPEKNSGKTYPQTTTVTSKTSKSNQVYPVQTPKVKTTHNTSAVVVAVAGVEETSIMRPVRLNGVEFLAMIDTGSKLSLIRSDVAAELNIKSDGSNVSLIGADSRRLGVRGQATVDVVMTLGNTTKEVENEFAIIDNLCVPVLLGWELLGWFKTMVSLEDRRIWFADEKSGIRLREEVTIPSRKQAVVSASLPAKVGANCPVLVVPIDFNPAVIVANTVTEVKENNTVNCLLANIGVTPIVVSKGQELGGYEVIEHSKIYPTILSTVNATMAIPTTDEVVQVGEDLSENQLDELRVVLEECKEAFSINNKIGETDLTEHDIELVPEAKPIVEPLRRRPLIHKQEASKQIAQMLQDGIIEASSSPWASAYVLVKKKTGDMRLCIDFRKLNNYTKKNVYPLPNVEDCLEPLSGNKYFSQLDLASGYWQIKMAEKAKEMTAFRTDEGHYQFRRMPFGLCNAPASFQRLVNALFTGLKGVHLQVFMDDICVATPTWSEHLSLLRAVFNLMIEANLRLKPSKCCFGASKVIFLGHELSRDGIRQDQSKLKAIIELPRPQNVAELRRALGMFSYYRKFVPGFAQLAEPLNRLLKKNTEYVWLIQQQEAFEALKTGLGKNITLATFSHDEPVALKTDASKHGVAGILLQQKQGEWQIITCCSRSLSQAESNYGISDLEGLAIIYSVNKFRNYLLGRHFVIITDHCALCALKLKTPTSKRLHRWAIALSEYDFEIRYVRGGLHQDVDCLSRAPVESEIDTYLDDKVLSVMKTEYPLDMTSAAITVPRDSAVWKQLYSADPEAEEHFAKARRRQKGYKIFDGLLYHENRLFVPAGKRNAILEEHHSDEIAGHGGLRATAERMSALWWPNMSQDIANFISTCQICQKRKAEKVLPAGTMNSFQVFNPFDMVAVDVLGPLTDSLARNKFVFVFIDCFTRFVDAQASETQEGLVFAKTFSEYIGRYGIPHTLLSDNSKTFCNQHTKILFERYNIEHRLTAPNHHRGNALVERVIQTIQEKLSLITHDPVSAYAWDEILPSAILSINTSYHSSVKYTPFELMFGRRHPVRTATLNEQSDPLDLFAELRAHREERMVGDAIDAQATAQAKSKLYFDQQHRQVEYNIGDLVLSRDLSRRAKLQNRFVGPYRVTKRDDDIYMIENVTGRYESLRRHVADLKAYKIRDEATSDVQSKDSDVDGSNNQSRSNQSSNNLPSSNLSSNTQSDSADTTQRCNLLSNQRQRITNKVAQYMVSRLTVVKEDCYMKWNLVIHLYLIASAAAVELIFKEAPFVSWQSISKYVAPSPTTFKLSIKWGQPCDVLRQFHILHNREETEVSIRQCIAIFSEQVTEKTMLIARQRGESPLVMVHQTNGVVDNVGQLRQHQEKAAAAMAAATYFSNQGRQPPSRSQVIAAGAAAQAAYYAGQEVMITPNQVNHNHQSNGQSLSISNNIPTYQSSLHKPGPTTAEESKSDELKRGKRSIGECIAAVCASNILETIVDRIWPNSATIDLQHHVARLDQEVATLNHKANFTALQLEAMRTSQEIVMQLVQQNIERVHAISSTYPALALVTSHIVAKMHLIGSQIDQVRVSFRLRKPDINTLYLLYRVDALLDIDPDSVVPESLYLSSSNPNEMTVEFAARRRSRDTMVYRVQAFKFWGEMLDQVSKQFQYVGPSYVIKNITSNCVRGLSNADASYVAAQCSQNDYEDHRLSQWKVVETSTTPEKSHKQTEVIEVWPFVNVLCQFETIVINGVKSKCPLTPIQLLATTKWNTETYDYSPSAVEINVEGLSDKLVNANLVHMKNISQFLDRDNAINRVRALNKKVSELEIAKTMFNWQGEEVTYQHATYFLAATIAFVVLTAAVLIYRRSRKLVKLGNTLLQERKRRRSKEAVLRFQRARNEERTYQPIMAIESPRIEEVVM